MGALSTLALAGSMSVFLYKLEAPRGQGLGQGQGLSYMLLYLQCLEHSRSSVKA